MKIIQSIPKATRIKVLKTITYRLWSSTAGFMFVLAFTRNATAAAWFSGMELIFKPIIYLIHEYLWLPYEKKHMDADSEEPAG